MPTSTRDLRSQSRMIIDDLKKRRGDARRYITDDVFEAMIAERVLSVVLAQVETMDWVSVRAFGQEILDEVRGYYDL